MKVTSKTNNNIINFDSIGHMDTDENFRSTTKCILFDIRRTILLLYQECVHASKCVRVLVSYI